PGKPERQSSPRRRDAGLQQQPRPQRARPAPLDLAQAMPLVERALLVLERREVQPQLGLLKSTMLQLDSSFSERAYGAGSFSELVEKLKKSDFVDLAGGEGRYTIRRKASASAPARVVRKPDEALLLLRDVLETHRQDIENGCLADDLAGWVQADQSDFDSTSYGFQEFIEFLNYAQDKLLVRIEPDEEKGVLVYLGAEFYPPAPEAPLEPEVVAQPDQEHAQEEEEEEDEGPQPIVEGQPSVFDPNPAPVMAKPARKQPSRRKPSQGGQKQKRTTARQPRQPRQRKAPHIGPMQ
ncbi:MAG: OST-HTH/LOTUS domain-containing protein, partial [Acidobacteriota bacterium]